MTTLASSTLALGPSAISADSLIKAGLAVVLLIVFAESGLLIGFFLPGDALLFTLGMLIARDEVSTSLPVAAILIGLAAIAGDQVGYLIGRKAGPALFRRPDSRLFKQEYVEQAEAFFAKNGPCSIVLARFVPIVRTFTPVIAGVSRMNYRVFTIYNILGGLLWGGGVTVLGFYLGKIDFIRDNIEAMLILVVLVSVVPIFVEFLRNRRWKRAGTAAGSAAAARSPEPGQQDIPDGRPATGWDGDGWDHSGDLSEDADPAVTMRLNRGGGRHSAAHRRETARD
ncbi:DedA family protein [Candidatus Frankia alpina]|uniref:DedA family protein n=1 Tax=Candidatus Frankia alpina TaxID=2699483 RepID=UPI0013D76FC1|nr:VTT domain-containing protein [Candidatus Frankia alpina]